MMANTRRPRGLSLVEGLFAILLTLLVLSALAETLTDTGKIRANRSEMDRAIEELHAMSLIRSDIVAAQTILRPTPSDTTANLKLRRVNPAMTFGDRISSTGDPTNPYEDAEMVEVEYRVRDEVLLRGVGPIGATAVEERVQPCHQMRVSNDGYSITLELTFAYSRVEKTRTLKVELR